jgi:hypothetical protein
VAPLSTTYTACSPRKALHELVVARSLQHAVLIKQIELLRAKGLVLAHRSIDRIAINTAHWLAAADQEFGEPACDKALSHAAFALQDEMNRRLRG